MQPLHAAAVIGATTVGAGVASYAGTRLVTGDGPGELLSGKIDHAGEVGEVALISTLGALVGGIVGGPFIGASEGPNPLKHGGTIGLAVLGASIAAGLGIGLAVKMQHDD